MEPSKSPKSFREILPLYKSRTSNTTKRDKAPHNSGTSMLVSCHFDTAQVLRSRYDKTPLQGLCIQQVPFAKPSAQKIRLQSFCFTSNYPLDTCLNVGPKKLKLRWNCTLVLFTANGSMITYPSKASAMFRWHCYLWQEAIRCRTIFN